MFGLMWVVVNKQRVTVRNKTVATTESDPADTSPVRRPVAAN